MNYKNHCKKCGMKLHEVAWTKTQPEFCKRCHPDTHWITSETLEKLRDVPTTYRKLVTLDILDDLPSCGDVEVFRSDRLFYQRELFETLKENPHLQPFAKTAGGDTWCWTAFRREPDQEPEILLIEDPWRVTLHAPSFEKFMYRTALEDAVVAPSISGNVPAKRVAQMASYMRKLGCVVLAEDLEEIVKRAPKVGAGLPPALINGEQMMSRLVQFIGDPYVDRDDYHGHVTRGVSFLKTGRLDEDD